MTDLSHLDSIADDAESITEVVLAAMSRTDDARLKQILDALVRHAHAFFREVQLTDREFEQGIEFVKAIGQATVDDHNEVVLCADVLGFRHSSRCSIQWTRPTGRLAHCLGRSIAAIP